MLIFRNIKYTDKLLKNKESQDNEEEIPEDLKKASELLNKRLCKDIQEIK